jgi:hypothetical protein
MFQCLILHVAMVDFKMGIGVAMGISFFLSG